MLGKASRAGEVKSTPIGPIQFPGMNWVNNGAIPFNARNRIGFQIKFWAISIIGLGLPFFNFERKVWDRRFKTE